MTRHSGHPACAARWMRRFEAVITWPHSEAMAWAEVGGCAEGSAEAAEAAEAERRRGEGEGHGVAFAAEAARAAAAVGACTGAGFEAVRESVLVVGNAQDGVEVGEDKPRSGIFEAADYAGAEVWGCGAGGEPAADIPEELVGEGVVEEAVIRL